MFLMTTTICGQSKCIMVWGPEYIWSTFTFLSIFAQTYLYKQTWQPCFNLERLKNSIWSLSVFERIRRLRWEGFSLSLPKFTTIWNIPPTAFKWRRCKHQPFTTNKIQKAVNMRDLNVQCECSLPWASVMGWTFTAKICLHVVPPSGVKWYCCCLIKIIDLTLDWNVSNHLKTFYLNIFA